MTIVHVVHNEEAKIKIRMDQITPPKDNDRDSHVYVVQKEGDDWTVDAVL